LSASDGRAIAATQRRAPPPARPRRGRRRGEVTAGPGTAASYVGESAATAVGELTGKRRGGYDDARMSARMPRQTSPKEAVRTSGAPTVRAGEPLRPSREEAPSEPSGASLASVDFSRVPILPPPPSASPEPTP